jgi:hypothetical protein
MSGVVNRSKPFVERLIADQPLQLDENAQRALAAWIAISTIMAEFTDPKTQAISAEDRAALMKTGLPPMSWRILIGRYSGKDWSPIRYRHVGGISHYVDNIDAVNPDSVPRPHTIPAGTPNNIQVTTNVIRSLLIHVFSSPDPKMVDFFRDYRVPAGMVPLWPIWRPVINWPCSPIFDDARTSLMFESWLSPIVRGG